MTANASHPGRITIPGTDIGVRGTLVAEPQTENMLLELSDRLALGPVKVDTDATGTLEAPGLVVPIVGSPTPVLWLLRFEPHNNAVPPFDLGVYNLNTSGVDLKDLVVVDVLTVDEATGDAALAAIGQLATLTATDDGIVSGLFGTSSATRTAADARYGLKPDNGARAVGKGELVFRVTDPPFNGVADGVTNVGPAINAAGVAAAAAGVSGAAFGRAVVEFPYTPDGYAASTLITLQPGVTYRGDRRVRLFRSGTNGNYLLDASAKADVTIEGFTLDSNGKITLGTVLCGNQTRIRDNVFIDTGGIQQAAGYPINFAAGATPVVDVTIENNRFLNMRNNIRVRGNTQRVTIRGNDVSGWSSTAIAVDGDATTKSADLLITGNKVHDLNAISRAVTTKQIAANVATLTLATAPDASWVVGQTVWVDIGDAAYDGNRTLSAVSGNAISWAKTAANSGPTATTGYVANGNRQPISLQSSQSGVAGAPGESSFHERVIISNNHVLGNYVNHQATANGGTADTISLHHTRGFTITGNVTEGSGDCGIVASYRSTLGTIGGNTVIGASGVGIAIGSSTGIYVKMLNITGNTVVNCGQGNWTGTSVWASAGINLRVLTGAIVSGNMLGDDQAVPTQQYGITMGDSTGTCTDVHLGPNQYVGNIAGKRLTPAGNVRTTIADTPTTISKPTDTALALNSTSLATDPHLTFTPEPNSIYEVDVVLGYSTNGVAGATPGVQVGLAVPAGTSVVSHVDSSGSNATGASTTTTNSNRAFQTSAAALFNAGGVTGATPARMAMKLRVTFGPTSGTFAIRSAQQTADAVNTTTIVAGSYLKYQRVA